MRYSNSPMHMRPCVKEALWDASIDKAVSKEPCTAHPHLVARTKRTQAAACDAKEIVKRRYQRQFLDRIGVRCVFPEPQCGSNSNTGNIATQLFQNSLLSYLESRKFSPSACGSSLNGNQQLATPGYPTLLGGGQEGFLLHQNV